MSGSNNIIMPPPSGATVAKKWAPYPAAIPLLLERLPMPDLALPEPVLVSIKAKLTTEFATVANADTILEMFVNHLTALKTAGTSPTEFAMAECFRQSHAILTYLCRSSLVIADPAKVQAMMNAILKGLQDLPSSCMLNPQLEAFYGLTCRLLVRAFYKFLSGPSGIPAKELSELTNDFFALLPPQFIRDYREDFSALAAAIITQSTPGPELNSLYGAFIAEMIKEARPASIIAFFAGNLDFVSGEAARDIFMNLIKAINAGAYSQDWLEPVGAFYAQASNNGASPVWSDEATALMIHFLYPPVGSLAPVDADEVNELPVFEAAYDALDWKLIIDEMFTPARAADFKQAMEKIAKIPRLQEVDSPLVAVSDYLMSERVLRAFEEKRVADPTLAASIIALYKMAKTALNPVEHLILSDEFRAAAEAAMAAVGGASSPSHPAAAVVLAPSAGTDDEEKTGEVRKRICGGSSPSAS